MTTLLWSIFGSFSPKDPWLGTDTANYAWTFCTFSTYSDPHSLDLSESPTGLSSIYINLWVLMHYYAYKFPLNTLERAIEQLDPKRDPEIQHSRSKYNSEYSIRWHNCFKLYISPCHTPTHHPQDCVYTKQRTLNSVWDSSILILDSILILVKNLSQYHRWQSYTLSNSTTIFCCVGSLHLKPSCD